MPFAINLRCDNSTCDPLRALWNEFGELEPSPSMQAMDYPPHLTLAIWEDIAQDHLTATLNNLFDNFTEVTARITHLNFFEAPHAIIAWAAPELPDAVADLHARLHASIADPPSRLNYQPGHWIPHCSLATNIPPQQKQAALDLVHRAIDPFEVVFDVADIASFLPVEVLHKKQLAATR